MANCGILSFRHAEMFGHTKGEFRNTKRISFLSFNKNNFSVIEDVKRLATEKNYTCLIATQTKFQPPPMKYNISSPFSQAHIIILT